MSTNVKPAPVTSNDPYEAAMNAVPVVPTSFGLLDVDIFFCVLKKGVGKALFDPQVDPVDQRRTAIVLTLNPLPGARFNQPMKRELIAESNEWTRIVKPSVAKLQTDLRNLKGRYVQVRLPVTGTYVAADGTNRNRTTFEFVAVFTDEAACQAAAAAFFAKKTDDDGELAETIVDPPAAAPPANDAGKAASTVDRGTALKFVAGLWKASKGDLGDFEHRLQSSKVTSGLAVTDPDVISIISASA